ncbi:Hcp family type VI secretion system effector [Novosphingobium terrae]|uniref:Hcp family type VI secretion system effector n=1 Tax=Novosphingobium terrae TaxID=2726189 RepID=UPI00197EB1F2|nr:type VI secretion system tube protein Hcp [Novosphingobium terrae]
MAVDLFLKIDGIDGESQKKGHEKEIDIISFNFGAAQHGSFHTGGAGGGSGKAEIRDISITKEVDKSSPKLFSACASGRHIPQIIIYSQKAGDGTNPLVYYKITLEDVIVSSVDNQGAAHGDAIMESIVFNTAKVTFDYQPQNRTGGKDGGIITASYDIRQNVAS